MRLMDDNELLNNMNHNDFNDHFTSTQKFIKRSFVTLAVIWVTGIVFCVTFVGALIYLAIHFLSKVW